MFWGIARALGRPLSYASALVAFMLIDIPSLTTYLIGHLWAWQYVFDGTFQPALFMTIRDEIAQSRRETGARRHEGPSRT